MTKKNYVPLSKEQRKEKHDNLISDMANLWIKGLKENKMPWQKPWEPGEHIFEHNPISQEKNNNKDIYQGINQIGMYLHREMELNSSDPRWLTFNQIREINSNIENPNDRIDIRGENSYCGIHYELIKLDKDGNKIKNDDKTTKPDRIVPNVNYFFVFNYAQCKKKVFNEMGEPVLDENGIQKKVPFFEPIERKTNNRNVEPNKIVEKLLKDNRVKVIHDQEDECYYSENDDAIHLVPPEQFYKSDEYFSTLFHEMTHFTGTENRLDRECFKKYSQDIKERAKEELIAEIGSVSLAQKLNLAYKPSENNLSYVNSWIKELENNPNTILIAVSEANKASNFLINAKEREKKENNKNTNSINNNEEITVKKGKSR